MRSLIFTTIFLMAGRAALPLSAQGTVAGRWLTEYEVGVYNADGTETFVKHPARLTLSVRGDSVTGEWRPLGEKAPRARGLRGTMRQGVLTLLSDAVELSFADAKGEKKVVRMTQEYRLELRGDRLEGTSSMHPEGKEQPSLDIKPVVAKREP